MKRHRGMLRRLAIGIGVGIVAAAIAVLFTVAPWAQGAAECPVGATLAWSGNVSWDSGTSYTVTLDHAATADRTITIQDAADTLVGRATTDTLTNKTLSGGTLTGTITATSLTFSGDVSLDGAITSNDTGADKDFRVESNNNANMLVVDAGEDQVSIGAVAPTTHGGYFHVDGHVRTAGANEDFIRTLLRATNAVTIPTGTANIVTTLQVEEPNITATGTVTTAATVRVANAPTEGGTNYALWVDDGTTRLDGLLSLAGNLEFTNALGSDHTGSGAISPDTVGENVSIGEVLYMKSDGKWWKADADAAATMPGAAIAMESISADASGDLLFYGFFRDDTWDWTVGGSIYVSTTAGALTQTAPSGAGDQVQILGIAITADIILLNPGYELVEISS